MPVSPEVNFKVFNGTFAYFGIQTYVLNLKSLLEDINARYGAMGNTLSLSDGLNEQVGHDPLSKGLALGLGKKIL